MSRELHDKLVEAEINPDRVLQSATKKIMRKFNQRFHPADSIVYAYGTHNNTATFTSIRAFPRRASDAYVACQHGPKFRIGTQGPDELPPLIALGNKTIPGRKLTGQANMPIESPLITLIGSRTHSEWSSISKPSRS